MCVQWNLSNPDTNGAEEIIVSGVSSFQRLMQEWYLGWEKVSCLERCPQFKIERERFHCNNDVQYSPITCSAWRTTVV